MKLRTFRIWLFLLPVAATIGVMLFVQSSNNREELEQQHIRSIAALTKDVRTALSDYVIRSEAFILRKGYAEIADSAGESLGDKARKTIKFFKASSPEVVRLKYLPANNVPDETLSLEKGKFQLRNHKVVFRREVNRIFQKAVKNCSWIEGRARDTTYVLTMDLNIPLKELMRKVEANDFTFDNFFLTDSIGRVLYPEQAYGTQIFNPSVSVKDSLMYFKTGISLHPVQYNLKHFHAYSHSLMLEQTKLYLLGLYSDSYYQKVGLRVNYNLISTLVFMLLVLVCSIPILAVVNMGKGDVLTQSRIIQVGVSLMALAVVVGFALSFAKNAPKPRLLLDSEIRNTDKGLTDSIERYQQLLEAWSKGQEVKNSFRINELITVDSLGFVQKIHYFRHAPKDSLQLDFGGKTSFTDLKTRAYVSFFDDLSHKTEFINSHYSRGTGLLESVISKRDPSDRRKIRAVTYLHRLDSTLNHGFRILLVKNDGSLLFKSARVESSISNLSESVSPEKWTEISSLFKNNPSLPEGQLLNTPLYLNGHHYEAYLSKLSITSFDQPLWAVFLVNRNVFHVFSALTSLEGVVFVVSYFLFLLATLLLIQAARKNEDSLGFKAFLFDWLIPSKIHQGGLILLIVTYLAQLVLLLLVLSFGRLNHLDTLLLFSISSLEISYFNLFHSKIDQLREKKIPMELKVISALLIALMAFSVRVSPDLWKSVLAFFFFAVVVSAITLKTTTWARHANLGLSGRNGLTIYLLVWFLMIGFLPGYLIQSKNQQFEQQIWTKSMSGDTSTSTLATAYELGRRKTMAALADPFDPMIQDFIYPNIDLVNNAWTGSKLKITSNVLLYLLFGGLLLITFLLIRWVQNAIFFEFKPHMATVPQEMTKYNFICCLSSEQIPSPINPAKTILVDFKYQTILSDFPLEQEHYIFYNLHCVKDLMDVSLWIARVKNAGGTVTVYSGTLWKNLFQTLSAESDRMIVSEIFSDFRFMVIELDEAESGDYQIGEQVLSKMKRRKAFYANIWTELSFEERQVCYAYAKEGFFNFAAMETLLDLAQKGVIVPEKAEGRKDPSKTWTLFSTAFRQFILTNITPEERVDFKKYEKKNGNITTIQTAVISFVLICIALVGIFDKTFLNEAYTYLTGGLGILGTLYSVLNQGFAGLGGAKKEA